MLIGVDLDNTIVCYDQVVYVAALNRGLIPRATPACKRAVRDHLRQGGKEEAWIELQGYVYGEGMRNAVPFPGAREFFGICADRGIDVCIVSHRTRSALRGPSHDLHGAAREWLVGHGFFDAGRTGLLPEDVYFELTRHEKLERIERLGCDHFIDDLPEILGEPGFPSRVQRILFDPNSTEEVGANWKRATSWSQIAQLLT